MKKAGGAIDPCYRGIACSWCYSRGAAASENPTDWISHGIQSPDHTTPDLNADAFQQGLRDMGYVEGKNIVVEYRYLEGKADRTPSIVAEFLPLKVDALVVITRSAIQAAKLATKTIPLVMVTNFDPVATGLVDSLANPGGNLTGLTRCAVVYFGKFRIALRNNLGVIGEITVNKTHKQLDFVLTHKSHIFLEADGNLTLIIVLHELSQLTQTFSRQNDAFAKSHPRIKWKTTGTA